ncbi:MAG: PhnD/SsuA/transferrin family substrate-binding protein [Litoreibacter sp.]|nr:PhnD/SsuA/transferrin family substrate-binding protein [Litoreibacter sp.]
MYERPETADAIAQLWSNLQTHIGREAQFKSNTHGLAHWRDPDLLISQTCGMPYRLHLHGQVHLVGTPVSTLGDPRGYYHSVIIARQDDPRDSFAEFEGAVLAYNDAISQSGWAAPQNMARSQGFGFSNLLETGGHRASSQAVATGKAELAAIDAVTWSLITRFDPWADRLKVIDRTPPTPALPFITSRIELAEPLYEAMATAIDELCQDNQALLCLKGITQIAAEDYLAVPSPPLP